MSEYKCDSKLDELFCKIKDETYKTLSKKLYESEIYRLGVPQEVDSALAIFLEEIINNPATVSKIAKVTCKNLLVKKRENERREREFYRNNSLLWKKSKGIIPCLNECGYTQKKSRQEVLSGFNSFICKECCDKLEAENKSPNEIFDKKNIYKIFGIQ